MQNFIFLGIDDIVTNDFEKKLLQKLLVFLQNNPKCILREIHKEFSEQQKQIDRLLEKLIQLKSIHRAERKYTLEIPCVSIENQVNLERLIKNYVTAKLEELDGIFQQFSTKTLEKMNETISEENLYFIFFSEIVYPAINQILMEKPQQLIGYQRLPKFYGYFQTLCTANQHSCFKNYEYIDETTASFYRYFLLCSSSESFKGINEENIYRKLYQILGDVQPDYCIKHCVKQLKRVAAGKKITTTDIFTEALLLMGYLSKEKTKNTFNIHIPIFYRSLFSSEEVFYKHEVNEILAKDLEGLGKEISQIFSLSSDYSEGNYNFEIICYLSGRFIQQISNHQKIIPTYLFLNE